MAQFGLIFCKTAQNSTHVAFLASSLKRASVRRGANTSSLKHRDMRRGSGMGAQAVCLSCSKKPLPGSRARNIWRAQGIWPARTYARTPGRQPALRPPGHRVRAAVRPSSPLARTPARAPHARPSGHIVLRPRSVRGVCLFGWRRLALVQWNRHLPGHPDERIFL